MTNVIIGEFVGTILLVLLGDGVCANVTLNNSGFKAAGALFIALGWGLAVALPAAAFSGICPASYNPALTIALFADGTLAAADGYTTTKSGDIGSVNADNQTAAFENSRNGEVDTGINLTTLPYILVFAGVIVIAGAAFITRRRKYED